jgi:hypothetical protein
MDDYQIIAWQRQHQAQFRGVREAGRHIDCCGQPSLVLPGVFWSFQDSVPVTQALDVRTAESALDVGTEAGVIAVRATQALARATALAFRSLPA